MKLIWKYKWPDLEKIRKLVYGWCRGIHFFFEQGSKIASKPFER